MNFSDATTTRIMSHCIALFGLKNYEKDSLLPFYSSTKILLHDMKTSESVAVTCNILLEDYLSRMIVCPELQSKVDDFPANSSSL